MSTEEFPLVALIYGNSNPDLKVRVKEDLEAFLESHPGVKKEEIPSDLLTASGSGLDPHISPEAARIQDRSSGPEFRPF